ncbi:MAG: class II aldolase [Thiotrichales bacterium]|nr:class II aldolase [Thiotrichales bacterium]
MQAVQSPKSIRDSVSEAEWEARVLLAAAYRITAMQGWTYLGASHISARVPGEDNTFLLNPHGVFFEEITASSLIKVDFEGNQLTKSDFKVNPAGFTIHSGVLAGRPDVNSVMHTHTRAGMAISAIDCRLLTIDQQSCRFHNRIGYHPFEGIAHDLSEGERLIRDLGPHHVMILQNHGLLTAGLTIQHTVQLMFYLETCSQVQIDAMSTGAKLLEVPEDVAEHTAKQFEAYGPGHSARDFAGLMRRAERADPSFKD